MATMFGRFEVRVELSKSDTASIYKALDTETNQVVALKTQSLEPLGDRADAFVETLIAEGEATRESRSTRILSTLRSRRNRGAILRRDGDMRATAWPRCWPAKKASQSGICSILRAKCAPGWSTQLRRALRTHSLEPAKIMVQWDGMVKILGYGISNMSLISAEAGNGLGRLMPYCSPEQIRGEAMDQKSNLFTLGTILYEMVTGRKAFDAEDPVVLVEQVENGMPRSSAVSECQSASGRKRADHEGSGEGSRATVRNRARSGRGS